MEKIISFLQEELNHKSKVTDRGVEIFKEDANLFFGQDIPEDIYTFYKECNGIYRSPFILYDFNDLLDNTSKWIEIIEEYNEIEIIGDFISLGEDNLEDILMYSFEYENFGISDVSWFSEEEENYLPIQYSSFKDLLYSRSFFEHLEENEEI